MEVEHLKTIIYVFICLHGTKTELVKIGVNLLFINLNEEMWKMLRDVNTDVEDNKFLFFKGFFFFDGRAEMLRWSEINPEAYFSKTGNTALTKLL